MTKDKVIIENFWIRRDVLEAANKLKDIMNADCAEVTIQDVLNDSLAEVFKLDADL